MNEIKYNTLYLKRKLDHLNFINLQEYNIKVKRVKVNHINRKNRKKRKLESIKEECKFKTNKKPFICDCLLHEYKYICNIYDCKGVFKINYGNDANTCSYII